MSASRPSARELDRLPFALSVLGYFSVLAVTIYVAHSAGTLTHLGLRLGAGHRLASSLVSFSAYPEVGRSPFLPQDGLHIPDRR
jgi:hypothetical protein